MVVINLYLLLGLLQTLLLAFVVLAIWIWRLHRTRRRMRETESELAHLRSRQTAVAYLESALGQSSEDDVSENELIWVQIRNACLSFELARARTGEQDSKPAFLELGRRLEALLQSQPATPSAQSAIEPAPVIDEEDIDFPEMLGRQAQLLEALRVQVHGAIGNTLDQQRCDENLHMLELVGRELEICTKMMEEENNFLRDQIRALLNAS